MTQITDQQLTQLRQRPHYTKLHLSVYQPNVVLAAQINMLSISRGEREITIDVLGGDVWSVTRGMTCYIGSTPDGRGKRIRAIDCTPTTITVAENDYNWLDGQYLTVVNYFEPWAVFPRITLDANNIPSFFKDYNIVYTNQNEQFDPVAGMGPNYAGYLDVTPSGSFDSVWYTSSGTYDPTDDSIPTGFAWVFEGGSPTATFGPDPGYIDYTGGGHFMTSLTVTANTGKTFTGRRFVSIYSRPDEGPAFPIQRWGMSSFDGARDNGGYSLRLWLREDADYEKISDGGLVVIWSDDYEGSFAGKAGGNAENRNSTLFCGYIEDNSIAINAITNKLEFRVESVTGVMTRLASFSATLENKKDAATWNEMTTMTVDKAMAHFLRWHSTILTIADFSPSGDVLPVQFMDFERASVKDAVFNLYASALLVVPVADRQGKIWSEIDVNVVPTGSTRGLATVLDMSRMDWRGSLDITVAHDDVLSYLEMGGIAYGGAVTGSTEPFLAGAPGDAPSYFGSLERVSGLVIQSQEQLNELTGNAWARANADYPEVTVPMAGDYRLIDIAPQERVLITIDEDDTYRKITWDDKPFIPQAIRLDYQAKNQQLLAEVTLREETDGPPGESVEIPVDPPFQTLILPEITLPPLDLPPPIPPLPIDPAPGTGDLAYAVANNGKFTRTRNLLDSSPTWEDITPTGIVGGFLTFILDPLDPQNKGYMLTSTGGAYQNHLYKITNLDSSVPIWTEIMSSYDMAFLWEGGGPTAFQLTMYDFDISPMNNQIIYICGSTQALGFSSYIARSYDEGATWTIKTLNYGRLQDSWNRVSASEHSIPSAYSVPGSAGGAHQHRFVWSADAGQNWTELWNNQVNLYNVPYQGNTGDLGLYESRGDGASKRLYYSEDRGVTSINITPQYLGLYWAVNRGGGGRSTSGGVYRYNVTTHPSNRLLVAALLQSSLADGIDNDTMYFTSRTGPEGLEPTFSFNYFNNRAVTALRWHRTNFNILTACGNPSTVGTVPGRILVTTDGGLSWADKFASWYTQIMSDTGTKPNFVSIELVWTV